MDNEPKRDFTTISRTAKGLLFMKAVTTTIPYVHQAAELVLGERAIDIECRYRTIDLVLAKTRVTNFFEIASGFSFRSLAMTRERRCCYLDTDLPEVINAKRELAAGLLRSEGRPPDQGPTFVALNAMEKGALSEAAAGLPPGPVAFICEGLLVYLNDVEKRDLCAAIREVLAERGGLWVTGDVYVKKGPDVKPRAYTPEELEFLAEHKVVENMFTNFETAKEFFQDRGFGVEQHTADEVYGELTSVQGLKRLQTFDEDAARARLKTRQTWVLTPK